MSTPSSQVHASLRRSILLEGYPLVLDLKHSHGQWLVDALTQKKYLDFFSFYASRAVRFDHPALVDPEFQQRLLRASRFKPSNSDIYTEDLAAFVERFRTLMLPDMLYAFFIDGGALAVENALKAAFDWKVRKNLARGKAEGQLLVLHFRWAFHGRSGYTLSLTNTADPRKTQYFPKFDWPRISSPAQRFPEDAQNLAAVVAAEKLALDEIDAVYDQAGADNIACIIVEPIQCEGGDRHFRAEFLQNLRTIADEREALLIFDEVQTGMGVTGHWWCYQSLGVPPDILAFAKKAQTGGVIAGPRLDEVDHVFRVKSRISSTFGGNLVDFIRAERLIEIIENERLLLNATQQGGHLLLGLQKLCARFAELDNPRGRGLLLAVDIQSSELRDRVVKACFARELIILPCGERGLRLRPALDVSQADCDEALGRLEEALEHELALTQPTSVPTH